LRTSLPCENVNDQIVAVIGDLALKHPFLLVRAVIDEPVLGLRRAQPVVIELLVVVARFELGVFGSS